MYSKRIWLLPFEAKLKFSNYKNMPNMVIPFHVPDLKNSEAHFAYDDIIIMYPSLRNLLYALFCWKINIVILNGEPLKNSRHFFLILLLMQWRFVRIFTHVKWYNRLLYNGTFLPVGGCWIRAGTTTPEKKQRLCSIISSDKNLLPGHKLRHEVIKLIQINDYDVDIMGSGYRFLEDKAEGLLGYHYSIVIENCSENDYFTEKLIDCFETDVVPIYWGCPNIECYFDIEGMILFNSLDELNRILLSLDEAHYRRHRTSMARNKRAAETYHNQVRQATNALLEKGHTFYAS